MTMGVRRSIAAVTAALGLSIGGAVWATSGASAAAGAPARAAVIHECTSSQLAVWISPDLGNGALGTIFYPLDFTNTSGRTCFVVGWPGVSAVNQNLAQLGSAAQRDPSVKRTVVDIAPRATAHATLRYVDAQVDSSAGCRAKTAAFLRVFPPDSRSTDLAFFDVPVCSVKGRIYLIISRVAPGVV